MERNKDLRVSKVIIWGPWDYLRLRVGVKKGGGRHIEGWMGAWIVRIRRISDYLPDKAKIVVREPHRGPNNSKSSSFTR